MQEHEESFVWLERSDDIAEWHTDWVEKIGEEWWKGFQFKLSNNERYGNCMFFRWMMSWSGMSLSSAQKPGKDGVG